MASLTSLADATFQNTPPFVPPITDGKVVKTYDGDTITVAAQLLGGPIYRFSVRIKGIDCPEMKSKDQNEKEVALKAKAFVQDLLLNQMVRLENVETEKYGRLLADVIYQGASVGDLLVGEHLAVRYDGGHKVVPDNWLEYWSK
jgi:micrococcal nuclease